MLLLFWYGCSLHSGSHGNESSDKNLRACIWFQREPWQTREVTEGSRSNQYKGRPQGVTPRRKWGSAQLKNNRSQSRPLVQSYPVGEGECTETGTATNNSLWSLILHGFWLLFQWGEWALCTGHQATTHCNHTSEAQGHGWESSASFKGFHS